MAATAKAEDSKDQGIISAAIANATALLRKPLGKGQENMGVLDQQAKQASANSQFTFTCESDVKGVTFPEQSLYSPGYTQRSGHLPPPSGPSNGQRLPNAQGSQIGTTPAAQTAQQPPPAQGQANTAGQARKPRRRRGDVYALAARQRKLQQEYSNIQHPPAPEDIWICEFCEYESIFGQPPRALIRQYEVKDRRERRRLAEKRRLLEKARAKSRRSKGKKANKGAANASRQAANPQQDYNDSLDPEENLDLDYGYDEEPLPMPDPPTAQQPIPSGNSGESGDDVDKG